jgi:hypothetical protein
VPPLASETFYIGKFPPKAEAKPRASKRSFFKTTLCGCPVVEELFEQLNLRFFGRKNSSQKYLLLI